MNDGLYYNGVWLPFTDTDTHGYENVYADDGSHDYQYTEVTFGVRTVISTEVPGVAKPGEDANAVLNRYRHALEQPRKGFEFRRNGAVVLEGGPDTDVAHGPVPHLTNVLRIDGSTAAYVEFRLAHRFRVCPEEGTRPRLKWLTNRWREQAVIGLDQATRRVRTGVLTIRSDMTMDPDAFRYVVTPPVPDGFRRESEDYAVESSGLALAYTFVDAEVYAQPPGNAVDHETEVMISSQNGATRWCEVVTSLTGNNKADRADLLVVGIVVAMNHLEKAGLRRGLDGRWLAMGEYRAKSSKAFIQVRIRAMVVAQPQAQGAPIAGVGERLIKAGAGVGVNVVGHLAAAGANIAGRLARGLLRNVPAKQLVRNIAAGGGGIGGGLGGGGRFANPGFGPGGVLQNNQLANAVPVPKIGGLDVFRGKPWGSEDDAPPDPGLRGTAGLTLAAAALNGPCLADFLRGGGRVPDDSTGGRRKAQAPAGDDPPAAPGGGLPGGAGGGGIPPGGPRADAGTAVRNRPAVTVTVVPSIDPAAFDTPITSGPYSHYELHGMYRKTSGQHMLIASVETQPHPDVKLHREKVFFEVWWTAERVGEPPADPPEDLEPTKKKYQPGQSAQAFDAKVHKNLVFLESEFSPGEVDLAPDGVTVIFRSAGRRRYGVKDPKALKYGALVPPWLAELFDRGHKPAVLDGPTPGDAIDWLGGDAGTSPEPGRPVPS